MAATTKLTDILKEPDPFGAKVLQDGTTRFRFWAPQQQRLQDDGRSPSAPRLLLPDNKMFLPMNSLGDGWYETTIGKTGHGTRYAFQFWNTQTSIPDWKVVPDPMSYWQEANVNGYSRVLDPDKLQRHDGWQGVKHEDLLIEQIHIGAYTPEGTLQAAIEKIPFLKELGFTAIQLMPLEENAASANWGYDGVLKTSIQPEYGTPEDLAALIAAAHAHGIAVFTDNVYNHWGPAGNYLQEYAPEFWHFQNFDHITDIPLGERIVEDGYSTPWGPGVNIDRPEVRKFIEQIEWYFQTVQNTDGVRRDAVHGLRDTVHEQDPSQPHLLTVMTHNAKDRAREKEIPFHVINEDQNDRSMLYHYDDGEKREDVIGDMQWADNIHHVLFVILTRDHVEKNHDIANMLTNEDGYYYPYYNANNIGLLAEVLKSGNAYSLDTPRNLHVTPDDRARKPDLRTKIIFATDHDQIGNTPKGLRLEDYLKDDPHAQAKLDLRDAITLLTPAVPQFYMGQAWRSEAPFPFFTLWDNEEIKEKTVEGREEELKQFDDFINPCTPETFASAKLDWDKVAGNTVQMEKFKRLVQIHREQISPHLASGVKDTEIEYFGETGLTITYKFGDGAEFGLSVNAGNDPAIHNSVELPAWGYAGKHTAAPVIEKKAAPALDIH